MAEDNPFPFPQATLDLEERLQQAFAISQESARINIIRAAATPMQNALYVQAPDGLHLAPTFQLAFLPPGQSAIGGAVQILHGPIQKFCEQIAEDLKETSTEFIRLRTEALYTEREGARKNIERLEKELAVLNDDLELAHRMVVELAELEAKGGELDCNDPAIRKKINQRYKRVTLPAEICALTASLHSAQDQLGEIYEELAGYRIFSGPHIFRQEASWRTWPAACKDSFDGALVDFVFARTTLDELRTLSPRQLNECACLLHNGAINSNAPYPKLRPRPKPSVILVGNRDAVLKTIRRERIRESHLFNEFLFFPGESSGVLPDAAARAEILREDAWSKVFLRLFTYMRTGSTEPSLQLLPEAVDLYFGFQKWCEAFQNECPENVRGYFDHWPHCGLRIALCLAGINWDLGSGVLDARYLRAAFELLKRHAGRQVSLLAGNVQVATADDRQNWQIEELVVKLRLHGPMTLRSIVRTFSRPSYPVVRQLLLDAVAQKRVEQRGVLFLATDVGVDPSALGNRPENEQGVRI